ncbi:phosphonate utilization associated transcriptional regulator [Phaeobacter sp. CECT 5382]|uniref:GntR family transcriptional regulator n=1 Tax=Rhodobacterales TaxID=204455 RepID=UPI0006D9D52D|nr:GntR family transcriptional regulator [Phaeobacter sp. CECT 5382]CUH88622.1 phosphonate utilization associated transcriptional regulator [Phaeobacter sp. CECT 5382]
MNTVARELDAAQTVQDRLNVLCDVLCFRICTLRYPPGFRLSETALAEEFACSRTPLRRVLAWLEREELISSRQGVGTFVTALDASNLGQNFVVRSTLERAVVDIDPIDDPTPLVARFEDLQDRCARLKAQPGVSVFAELDMEAFDAFVEVTGNEALRQSCKSYYGRTTRHQLHSLAKDHVWLEAAYDNLCAHLSNMHSAVAAANLEAAAYYQIAYTRMIAP